MPSDRIKNWKEPPNCNLKRSRPTLMQIAALCNVSIATVSRVLNEPDRVKPDTRELVLGAVRDTGYARAPLLAGYGNSHAPLLGMIASRPADPLFQRTANIVEYAAEQHGLDLHLAFSGLNPARELALLQRFQSYRVPAVALFVPSSLCEKNLSCLHGDVPRCLFLWDVPQDKGLPYIAIDGRQMALNAMRYLLSLGHRRIGFVISLYKETQRRSERIEGYKIALQEYGVALDQELLFPIPNDPNLTAEPQDIGRIATRHLLMLPEPPTAILYASDAIAMGGMIAVQDAGLTVPEDVSIMGMCDTAISAHIRPSMTTIRQPFQEAGRLAEIFFEQVIKQTRHAPCQHLLQTELVIRASCTSPPKAKRVHPGFHYSTEEGN